MLLCQWRDDRGVRSELFFQIIGYHFSSSLGIVTTNDCMVGNRTYGSPRRDVEIGRQVVAKDSPPCSPAEWRLYPRQQWSQMRIPGAAFLGTPKIPPSLYAASSFAVANAMLRSLQL
ncbi:hypothetical protein EVAR_50705_1 [Eumeta japonica]|uniref:Uncharacterized protein n=1 Tax=Eumeta variegata TaxID=151549 RepID=A0A4C1YSY7_EUMVA|nr:hypothetical protein EVAR_50705_1 [Eumeta japonica]